MTIEHIEKVLAGVFPNAPPRVMDPCSLTGSKFTKTFQTDQDLHVFLKNFRSVSGWGVMYGESAGWTLTIEVPDGDVVLPPKPYRQEDHQLIHTFRSVEAKVKAKFPKAKTMPFDFVPGGIGRAVFKYYGELDDLLDSIAMRYPSIAEWGAIYSAENRWEFFYTTLAC